MINKPIRSTGIFHDYELMKTNCLGVIDQVSWGEKNQICLNSRENNIDWFGGAGSSYDRIKSEKIFDEKDFVIWNNIPDQLLNSLLDLQQKEKIQFGRIRLMRLRSHTGLSVHRDLETRYHYVIKTDPRCYFGFSQVDNLNEPTAICYHLPTDGQWYHVDTTQLHFVYNGSPFDRIHLVVCAL